MRFNKPSWVAHYDNHEPPKRVSIFSISVHPDGSRVATGGLDAKIRIWSTAPIVSPKAEEGGRPKSLCTLTMHTGPVLVVRWASSGKWLASGSDDTVVMIWDLDPNGGGKVWGTDDVNIEGWKALRRLTGHESDVVDCAWSPADRYLASVGLDSKVFIWCGYTLECIRRLDGHQGFVKGVCWDPVGEYLATQSDDKTVKVWRSADWGLETTISKPFETSPGSTFFNRVSWSPDASYLCSSNAMNSNAVFVAAVIERDTWNSNVSLVGHENTIQVASYNPRIFMRDPSLPIINSSPRKAGAGVGDDTPRKSTFGESPLKKLLLNEDVSPTRRSTTTGEGEGDDEEDEVAAGGNVFSVVALGADDRSISIWRTIDPRPLVVAKEAFDRQILDLSWSANGLSVWACSSDGTIAVLDFSEMESGVGIEMIGSGHGMEGLMRKRKSEMEGITTAEQTREYIKTFDFPWPPPLEANRMQGPSGYGGGYGQYQQSSSYMPSPQHQAPTSYGHGGDYGSNSSSGHYGYNDTSRQSHQPSPTKVGPPPPPINQAQKVTVTKSGKKRIQPTFLGGGSAVTTSSGIGNMGPPSSIPPHAMNSNVPTNNGYSNQQDRYPPPGTSGGRGMDWAPEGTYTTPSSSPSRAPTHSHHSHHSHSSSHHSRREENGYGYGSSQPYQLPSGSRAPGSGEARLLPPPPNVASPRAYSSSRSSGTSGGLIPGLEVPPLKTHVSVGGPNEVILEARNSDDPNTPTEILCAHGSTILWIDFVPARALAVVKTALSCAVALDDCSLIVYSPSGRRHMPTLSLDSPVSIIAATGKYVLIICASGSLHVWNVQTRTAAMPPTSIASQVTSVTGGVSVAKIYDNGAVVVSFASGTSISWDKDLSSWVRLTENWWRSAASRPRRGSRGSEHHSPVHSHHGSTPTGPSSSSQEGALGMAVNLGAHETRLHAAKILGSATEYASTLTSYAGKLADDGLVDKADELVRELCGPVFWDPSKPGQPPTTSWDPKILGMNKRDLLRDILPILARGRALSKMAQEWQVLLARIDTEREL